MSEHHLAAFQLSSGPPVEALSTAHSPGLLWRCLRSHRSNPVMRPKTMYPKGRCPQNPYALALQVGGRPEKAPCRVSTTFHAWTQQNAPKTNHAHKVSPCGNTMQQVSWILSPNDKSEFHKSSTTQKMHCMAGLKMPSPQQKGLLREKSEKTGSAQPHIRPAEGKSPKKNEGAQICRQVQTLFCWGFFPNTEACTIISMLPYSVLAMALNARQTLQ